MSVRPKHFLDLDVLPADVLKDILDAARRRKDARIASGAGHAVLPDADRPCEGKLLAMVFAAPSTRTRVSFDVAMRQLGGQTVLMSGDDTQIGRGESITDTARVLSRYSDAIVLRATDHQTLTDLAAAADIPVINGLTDRSHPCQVMADLLTLEERKGGLEKKTVAWIGVGNNMTRSWIHAAARFGFHLKIAAPPERPADPDALKWAQGEGAHISVVGSPQEAATGADCITTDVWVSMGESGAAAAFRPWQVTADLMACSNDAVFLHCLPAHRGEEVAAEVIDGPHSAVFDEAENRLHIQKAILEWCLKT